MNKIVDKKIRTMCTDTFGFEQQQFFQDFIKNLPANETKQTKNLLEYKEDLLYAWDSQNCSVMCFNWKLSRIHLNDSIKYQTLIPSTPQNHDIEKLTASNEGMFLALSGRRGVTIVDLPRRWGTHGLYKDGQDKIICKSYNLDEKYFTNNPHLQVLQVRWHPISPIDSILIVLLSNNYLRVYDDCKLIHVWRIGPIPSVIPQTGHSNVSSYLNSLGDTAVDFDIAPPRVIKNNDDDDDDGVNQQTRTTINTTNDLDKFKLNTSVDQFNKTVNSVKAEWPIVILRGNGSIYILLMGIDTKKPHIEGPITMLPSVTDNYGVDSCSLLIIPSTPPTIVIAESTGKLHHGLLMESTIEMQLENTKSLTNLTDASLKIYPSEWYIQILETVELELGLHESKNNNEEIKYYSCPIYLTRDIINDTRYFAYHNTGLHSITVQFIRELADFINNDSNVLDPPSFSNPSKAEYLVCTKAYDCNQLNVIFGFVLLQNPSGLLLILASGQIVSLNVITDPRIFRDRVSLTTTDTITADLSDLSVSGIKYSTKNGSNGGGKATKFVSECFETHIHNILTMDVQQPLLKLDKASNPSVKDSLELVLHSLQVLREYHLPKHMLAYGEIQKRVKQLLTIKQQQLMELSQLQSEKVNIRAKAERLAELYEDTVEKQMSLYKRAQEVVRLATIHSSSIVSSPIENDFDMQIEKINAIVKVLSNNIGMAKRRIQSQEIQMNKQQEMDSAKLFVLPPKQETIIKEILTDVTQQIDGQIKEIKKYNNLLNLA